MNNTLASVVKLIVPALLIIWTTYSLVQVSIDSFFEEKKRNLSNLSMILEEHLEHSEQVQTAIDNGDYGKLDQVIQDMLGYIIITDSNLGAGLFLPEEGMLIAQAPKSDRSQIEMPGRLSVPELLEVSRTRNSQFSTLQLPWLEKPVYNYARVIGIGTQKIAILNVNEDSKAIDAQITMMQLRGLGVGSVALAFLALYYVSAARRVQKAHQERDIRVRFERKQKEHVLDEVPIGIMILDKDGEVTYTNPFLCQLIGYTQEELQGWTSENWRSHYRLLDSEPVGPLLKRGEMIQNRFGLFHHRSGREMPFSITVRDLPESDGESLGHLLFYHDLSSEFALDRLTQKQHYLFDSIPLSVILFDASQRVEYINRAVCELFGKSERELLGHLLREALPVERQTDTDTLCDHVGNVLATGTRSRLVDLPFVIEGRECYLELDLFPIFNPFKETTDGCMLLIKDMTLDREWSELSQRVDAHSHYVQMAATIAHEVRNPMTSVRGFLQLLGSDGVSEQQRMYIDVAKAEIDRMNAILSEYLSMARHLQPERERLDLGELLRETFLLLEGEANYRGVTLELAQADSCRSEGVARELKQVLINLVRNAFDALPSVEGRICIALETEPGEVLRHRIRVTDNGCGIAPEQLGRVFDPFFTTKAMGTGLGLAVCKKIIEAHGGALLVESTVGVGTMFTITLPGVMEGDA